MNSDIKQSEKAYWTKDVADILDMAVTTVRKYALLMESSGYIFIRNEHNQRAFLERDIILLKRIKSLSKTPGVTIEDAVHAVLKDVHMNEIQNMSPPDTKQNEPLQKLIARYDNEFNQLKNDNAEIKELLKELQSLIQSFQEDQRELIESSSTKQKKSFWTRFF